MKSLILILTILVVSMAPICHADTFVIRSVTLMAKPPKEGRGIWVIGNAQKKVADEFVPCIEVKVETSVPLRSKEISMKAYFFDAERKPVGQKPALPGVARRSSGDSLFAAPVMFKGGVTESIFFPVPKNLLEPNQKWTVVTVFGDSSEMVAAVYPGGTALFGYEFPEKKLLVGTSLKKGARVAVQDPVIAHEVQTLNPKQPKITLFLRFPEGIKDTSEVQGVLAMCVLANNAGEIQRRLQEKNSADFGTLYKFADQKKFAILCWGAQTLWNPGASYDELDRNANKQIDKGFDQVAAAWERGVEELHDKYGLPDHDFLLWGICASAQWAHRLVLRKPDHFLAAFVHIPSSFDKPTEGASKVLWLLTSGELDGGYQHGVRWYRETREAGFPIIYKAFMNLGHAGSPAADALGIKFFEYALTVRDQRAALDKEWSRLSVAGKLIKPWLAGFREPEFYGDYLNQEVVPASQKERIPESLRVPLPTKAIADAWNK